MLKLEIFTPASALEDIRKALRMARKKGRYEKFMKAGITPQSRYFFMLICVFSIILSACGAQKQADESITDHAIESRLQESDITVAGSEKEAEEEPAAPAMEKTIEEPSVTATEEAEKPVDHTAAEDALFEDMARYGYSFSSGVGGWGTDLSINPDGTFSGSYSDSDMGSTGEGFPNGTLYYCEFNGRFSHPVYVDEYTYTTEIEELYYSDEPEKEKIEDDGVRYISSTAYGLDEAKTIYIYKPGKPYTELPEGYVWWVNAPTGGTIEEDRHGEMENYGIYNENADCGFISFQHDFNREDIIRIYKRDLEKHEVNDTRFCEEAMDQFTMNMLCYDEFRMWDDLLNNMWSYLKKTLDEETMKTLTEEQRAWIKEKEETVSEESEKAGEGSMQYQIENGTAARITRERVEYLVRKYVE